MTPGHPCQVWLCLFSYFCLALVYAPSKLTVVRNKAPGISICLHFAQACVCMCAYRGENEHRQRWNRQVQVRAAQFCLCLLM